MEFPDNHYKIRQIFEVLELITIETRNKYEVLDKNSTRIAYIAEKDEGAVGFVGRQLLGHWRDFEILFYDLNKESFMKAHHPFRFYFSEFNIHDESGYIGGLRKRFSLLNKRFDLVDENNEVLLSVSSPFWRLWRFDFLSKGKKLARVKKKWSGLVTEMATDRDFFEIDFHDPRLSPTVRKLLLASAVFVDLLYFEKKA